MLYLMKKSLNSDGHQFLQYQQNEESPLILAELWTQKSPRHKTLEIQVLVRDRLKNVAGLNLLSSGSFYFLT